ncbi:hypothetical protein EVAR_80873_1 [Eumeta japonica]|uniref:Uncharacterized protein n=1 Tax=Eumeta variegata TaxID=151549 RepID=A0A4C1V1F2_EUMVA|nr:hypothetical protein EVAR_80873_1 [Eumeta japonica]
MILALPETAARGAGAGAPVCPPLHPGLILGHNIGKLLEKKNGRTLEVVLAENYNEELVQKVDSLLHDKLLTYIAI